MSSEPNNLAGTIMRTLRADPKKTGSLAVLLIILIIMGGRQLTGGKAGRPASAAGASAESKGNSASRAVAASNSRPGVAEAFQQWIKAPVPPISRNLFAVRIEYFPLDGSRTTQSGVGDGGFWSILEKSLTLQTDEKVRQENLVASFVKEAEKLQLQSTLPEAKKAMINGQLVGEGSVVANFRVVGIEPRKVIVEREGIVLEIKMK